MLSPAGQTLRLDFVIIGSILNRSVHLQGVAISFRSAIVLAHAFLGPYFILFWFLLLGLLVPLYRRRLAPSFGYEADGRAPLPDTAGSPSTGKRDLL